MSNQLAILARQCQAQDSFLFIYERIVIGIEKLSSQFGFCQRQENLDWPLFGDWGYLHVCNLAPSGSV